MITPSQETRLALLERDVAHHRAAVGECIERIEEVCEESLDEVKKLRAEFTDMVVELAVKRQNAVPLDQREGLFIPKWLVISFFGAAPVVGAGLVELVKLIISATK